MAFEQFLERLVEESQVLAIIFGLDRSEFKAITDDLDQFDPVGKNTLRMAYNEDPREIELLRFEAGLFFAEIIIAWPRLCQQIHAPVLKVAEDILRLENVRLIEEKVASVTLSKIEEASRMACAIMFAQVSDWRQPFLEERRKYPDIYSPIDAWLTPERLTAIVTETE